VADGSVTNLVATLSRDVTVDEVNEAFRAAATDGPLAGVLVHSEDPIVSSDVVGSPASCIFDAPLTPAMGKPGQGAGLVRQRVGLHQPAGRPGHDHRWRTRVAIATAERSRGDRPPPRRSRSGVERDDQGRHLDVMDDAGGMAA
jgi:hypothetical protein